MRIDYVLLDASVAGGTVRTVFTMSQALAARGHQVRIISLYASRPAGSFPPPPEVPIVTLLPRRPPVREWWRHAGPAMKAAQNAAARRRQSRLVRGHDHQAWRYTAASDKALRRYVRDTDAEVIIGTRAGINLALGQLDTQAVRVVQEHVGLHLLRRPAREAFAATLPAVDAVVTLTRPDARRYRRLLGPGTWVEAIPNAVERPPGPRVVGGARVAIAAGRLAPQKGFDLLVDAWRPVAEAHPDWTLHVYGRGELADQLQELIDAHGLSDRVLLKGFAPDLRARLQQGSAFVLSSRFEGMPMVLLEAMAAGLPVVAFDCPTGPRQVIRHESSGLLVPRESVPDLSAALLRLVADADLRRRLAQGAVDRIEDFSVERIATRWERLLENLVGRSPDGGVGRIRSHSVARSGAAS